MVFNRLKELAVPTLFIRIAGMGSISLAAYASAEKTGIFTTGPRTWIQVFHSPYFLVLVSLSAFSGLGGFAALLSAKKRKDERYTGLLLLFAAGTALYAALWVSVLFRFEGRVVLSELESFQAFPSNYARGTVYRGRYAQFPKIGFTVVSIKPEVSADGEHLKRVDSDILYASSNTRGIREGVLDSVRPLWVDWTSFTITDFGYRPKFVLSDTKGIELEQREIAMKLFPPGFEEFYEPMYLGYLFYLQCYPDYEDRQGAAISRSAYPRNPVFRLRIVRNKDIVYNGLLKPTERVRFDRVSIAVPEVKMWVEVTIVRDFAYPVLASAALLLLAGAAVVGIRREFA